MRRYMGTGVLMALTLIGYLIIGIGGGHDAHAAGPFWATEAAAPTDAAAYCVSKHGVVEVRMPYGNTNANKQSDWFRLAGYANFCKFTSAKDHSRIYVLLSTLYTPQPTLAALAYYAKTPFNAKGCPPSASPAACYCAQLNGTDTFGAVNLDGGGWVNKSDPDDVVLDTCIFPDLSAIDSFGLFYHQDGTIRGRNLVGALRYPNPNK